MQGTIELPETHELTERPSDIRPDVPVVPIDTKYRHLYPSAYIVGGAWYLATRGSMAALVDKLQDTRDSLSRVSGLLEACDMGWARGQGERIEFLNSVIETVTKELPA